MLKYLIDKFRQAPGPLKQPRLIAADLAEEVLDLVGGYLKNRGDGCCEDAPVAREEEKAPTPPPEKESTAPAPAPAAPEEDRKEKPKKATKKAAQTPKPELELAPELTAAMSAAGNMRKQEFKVLAILWDARSRKIGPLSAKSISQHGTKMGLAIRHENVRKVIRMRLEDYVDVHAEGVGSGTIYRYEIADSGAKYFTDKYFE